MLESEVKERLMSYRYCLQRIDRNMELIQQLRAGAEKVTTSYSQAPGGTMCDSLANAVAKIADVEKELQQDTEKLREELVLVRFMIDSLDNYEQRNVLNLKYISGYSIKRIADKMFYTRRQTYRIHDKAIELLSRL